ncbi:MAG: hypothetical protein RIE06_11455 [Roseibium album]|uniref:hypothetical protein n=1 Tax=Roseibium album TaxID=311410 RepID=UPI0032EA9144
MFVRLMPESRSLGKARHEGRCGASVKWRNAADALLSGTRRAGLFLLLRRWLALVVGYTVAHNPPGQQKKARRSNPTLNRWALVIQVVKPFRTAVTSGTVSFVKLHGPIVCQTLIGGPLFRRSFEFDFFISATLRQTLFCNVVHIVHHGDETRRKPIQEGCIYLICSNSLAVFC